MIAYVIIFVGVSIVCGLSMTAAWFLKLRSVLFLLLASAVGAALVGGFFAQAGSAMATSVHPRDALIRGMTMGFVMGLVWGAVCVGILKATGKYNP